ncbi:hypothetical protein [Vibrio sonorensis]|uniref:hypothetical protein n=1 Tax=Vibrio sonorensis TaxID=1004316 RepID=UPI0008DA42E1|nr:hypothetical protein [Vibrio sonorensis]
MNLPLPLLSALIINGAGHAFFAISLPAIGRSSAISDSQIAVILSLPAIAMILSAPVWGWFAIAWEENTPSILDCFFRPSLL